MRLNVLKQASLPDTLTAELARRYHLVKLTALTDVDFRTLAGTFTVLIINGEATVTRELVVSLPALELIAVFGVGCNGVDMQAVAEHQVRVSHTPGALTNDVTDLALGLMLAISRQIVTARKFTEADKWAAGGFPWAQKVSGSQVDIVGMGCISQAIARRCEGFVMQTAYHSRKRLPTLDYTQRKDLLTLAAENDFLVICASGTAAGQGLINQPMLTALGKKGILVNISRGSVVDEPALVATLGSGIIAGTGLGVFNHEPAIPAGLLQRNDVVVTPHMANATWSTRAAMAQLILDNIACWAEKKALVTPVAESLAD